MKTVDLNRTIVDVAGNPVSIANIRRMLAPGIQTTPGQEAATATYASIAFPAINNQRGRQLTNDQVNLSYSTLKKVNDGVTAVSVIVLEDAEFAIMENVFTNMPIDTRAPFIAMIEELNPIVA